MVFFADALGGRDLARTPHETKDLFPAGPMRFLLAELGLVFHLTIALDFHKLVDHAERRHIP